MLKEARKLYKKMKMKTKTKTIQLPLSLIELQILPRLPAKYVGRFMSVCKQRKSFLSSPTFARMHLHHVTINAYKLLTLNHRRPVSFRTLNCEPLNDSSTTVPSYRNFDPMDDFVILASLDGLVCLDSTYLPGKLAFWNPLTGAYKRLSANPNNPFPIIGAFDAIDWIHGEFSVGSNIGCDCTNPILWGECLYFNVAPMSTERNSWIICFDVKTEKFREIQCPVVPSDAKDDCRSLVVLNGRLHLCASYKLLNMKHGDVWRVDGDVGWVKVAAFSRNKCRRQCVSTVSVGNWLAVLKGDHSFSKMNTEDFIARYWDFCSPRWLFTHDQIIYIETLVSPT
ncbi:F-box/kelch-repeat protein At3g06240-like [Bidens hawaiensis]|uniref:F-box/kelch-repeat protein At3g06240-like n=1 Tax=Bidens hawaiensis TaxID=980011 RepID=UPI004049A52B